jgi:hypothetical protein
MLYALAVAGATVDNQVLSGPVNSYTDQVNKVFIPNYASQKGQMWNSSSAIFIISSGNNDVYDGYNYANTDGLVDTLMQSYWNSATEALYQAGARKFLFVSTPSQEKSQKVLVNGPTAVTKFKQLKWKFNDALFAKRDLFKANHTDVSSTRFRIYAARDVLIRLILGPSPLLQLVIIPQPDPQESHLIRLQPERILPECYRWRGRWMCLAKQLPC